MIIKIEGFIISETLLGESSKVINILTKDKGIIGAVAKNSTSIKNPLRVKSTKFTYGIFHLRYYENKLSKLIEVDIIDNLSTLKSDILLISCLSCMVELTSIVARNSFNSSLFEFFINTVKRLNNNDLKPLVLLNILEVKYLKLLGVMLCLNSCVVCGDKSNIITLVPSKGGLVCNDHYNNEFIYNNELIKTLRLYDQIDIKKIIKIDLNDEIVMLVNNFINDYYDDYSGISLKSKRFLIELL